MSTTELIGLLLGSNLVIEVGKHFLQKRKYKAETNKEEISNDMDKYTNYLSMIESSAQLAEEVNKKLLESMKKNTALTQQYNDLRLKYEAILQEEKNTNDDRSSDKP